MSVDMGLSAREAYCAVLANGPLLRADAIVLLAGEDAQPRVAVAVELMRQTGATALVVTGGVDGPPRWMGAERLKPALLGKGVAPSRVMVDTKAMNTRDQAMNTVRLAQREGWKRLLVAVSPYHQYRAHLTFVAALMEAKLDDEVQVMVVPAGNTEWGEPPEGMTETRLELLAVELAKCDEYRAHGHVASWEDGLEYLAQWEGV